MEKTSIILKESVSAREVDGVAYENNWVVAKIIKGTQDISEEVIFQTDDDKNFVHYIIEKDGGYPYFVVQGESIETTVNAIRLSLPTYSREEIFRMIQAPDSEEVYWKGILYLGLLGILQPCDITVLKLFERVLQNPDPEVRVSGLIAMAYPGWHEFRDLVQPLAENDPDINVRKTANRFIEGLKREHVIL